MTLTELRYVVAVARERHFGRAAEACCVSQPTLSVGVKKLEEELGMSIFERTAAEVTITAAGERIVEQAVRVLEEANTIRQIAAHSQNQLSTPLRLGAIYTIGPYVLPKLIPNLHESAPEMPLLIEENFTSVLSERLRKGELDAIIVAEPFELPNVATAPLYEESFVVTLPSGHPWEKRSKIKAQELAKENLLLLGPGHCFRDHVLQFCPECQRSTQDKNSLLKSLEGSSLETIRYMVASGAGITVLPQTSISYQGDDNPLLISRPFSPPVPSRRVVLAWRKSFPRPEAIEAITTAIKRCALEGVRFL